MVKEGKGSRLGAGVQWDRKSPNAGGEVGERAPVTVRQFSERLLHEHLLCAH